MIRACTEISCGCESPECYQVDDQGDFFVFTNEDNNQKFFITSESFFSGLKNKAVSVNSNNLSQNAIAKLIKAFGERQ